MRTAVIGAAAAFMATAALARPAVWETYPKLVCRGDRAMECSIATQKCAASETNALWSLDFPSKTLRYLNLDSRSERILTMHQSLHTNGEPYADTIYLESGRILSLEVQPKPLQAHAITLTELAIYDPGVVTVSTLSCAPP